MRPFGRTSTTAAHCPASIGLLAARAAIDRALLFLIIGSIIITELSLPPIYRFTPNLLFLRGRCKGGPRCPGWRSYKIPTRKGRAILPIEYIIKGAALPTVIHSTIKEKSQITLLSILEGLFDQAHYEFQIGRPAVRRIAQPSFCLYSRGQWMPTSRPTAEVAAYL
jgi:hypothetical protein